MNKSLDEQNPPFSVEPPDGGLICIVGTNTFNTEILSSYLAECSGMVCKCVACNSLDAIFDEFPTQLHLIFYDCSGLKRSFLWNGLKIDRALNHPHCFVFLHNVEPHQHFENDALQRGVRGILYKDTPINFFPLAIKAVMKGELWYSRRILGNYLMAEDDPPALPVRIENSLTLREREILSLLASGISNHKIAETLRLSPHTVKTHVYNIYHKLNVSSRLHAASFATAPKFQTRN
jgi:LuxR family transcriptional regulator of csgAB operon